MPSLRDQSLRLPPPSARLCLLGGFELQAGAGTVRLPPRVQRLLAFLALQGRPLHRAYVAGRLWIDLSQDRAHGCLRTVLWRLSGPADGVVEVSSTHLALAPGVAVDARELETCIECVLHEGATPSGREIDELTHVFDLLPDWYDDWILPERERLRQLRLLALEAVGDRLIGARRYAEAAVAAVAAVAADPLRESAYRLLIRSYLGEGNVSEALRQFAVYRAQLARELGLEPTQRILELVRELP